MSLAWFNVFEERVREAAGRIGRLQRENKRLKVRVRKLEKAAKESGADADWESERRELKRRVQKLTERLEKLLED